ncbi:hypothetical protein [Gillisia sp. CAL575]|uniref:hypothetical protein n=1 Tax=Gillisia sp. CAL575 TaxID=985255 RepID=UPI00039E7006|nr:hypothetical protein [Gillisia sp. CAL575]
MNKNLAILGLFILSFIYSCETDNSPQEPEVIPEIENLEILDPNFKHALLNTNCVDSNDDGIGDRNIDLNDDGEIQKMEAESAKSIILKFNYEEIITSVDLRGIENFINIEKLEITRGESGYIENTNENEISYDLTSLIKLTHLKIKYLETNYIEKINLSGLNNLIETDLSENNASYFVQPDELAYPKDYVEFNFEGCNKMMDLKLRNSFLIIDFCQIPSLKRLDMSYLEGGEPEVFDFHCLKVLEWLDISENYIETLILKNESVLNTLLVNDIGTVRDANYPFVDYICIDDIQEEHNQISGIIDENTEISFDCSF